MNKLMYIIQMIRGHISKKILNDSTFKAAKVKAQFKFRDGLIVDVRNGLIIFKLNGECVNITLTRMRNLHTAHRVLITNKPIYDSALGENLVESYKFIH